MFNIQKAQHRAALFGGVGGFLGWILAQSLWGSPASFGGAVVVGAMAGLGIGSMLGISEGVTSASASLLKRGLLAGVMAGILGGTIGAFVGQLGFLILSGNSAQAASGGRSSETVFSSDVSRRLAEAGAKTGEIEVSLIWENSNDLDLHVVEPNGDRIFFQQATSSSGGELDVDRNASCAGDITTKPIEHIVWTGKSAPIGTYEVAVHHFMNCGPSDPTPYRLEVKIGDEMVTSYKGQLTHDPRINNVGQLPTVLEFVYPHNSTKAVSTGSSNMSAAIGRMMGWLVFGVLVGCAEGVKRRSQAALVNAAIGGAIGGGVGGLLFQLVISAGLPDSVSRLVGFVVLGTCIGLLIAIVEQLRSSFLVIENGRFAGREIAIDRPLMRIGRSDALEVYVGGDRSISLHHATVEQQAGSLSIAAAEAEMQINGVSKNQSPISDGDRIKLGETIFLVRSRQYGTKSPEPAQVSPRPTPVPVPASRPIPPPPGKPKASAPAPASKPPEPSTAKVREPLNSPTRSKLPPPPPKRGNSGKAE